MCLTNWAKTTKNPTPTGTINNLVVLHKFASMIQQNFSRIFNRICSNEASQLIQAQSRITDSKLHFIGSAGCWLAGSTSEEPIGCTDQTAQVETNQVADTWRDNRRGEEERGKDNEHFGPEEQTKSTKIPGGKRSKTRRNVFIVMIYRKITLQRWDQTVWSLRSQLTLSSVSRHSGRAAQ